MSGRTVAILVVAAAALAAGGWFVLFGGAAGPGGVDPAVDDAAAEAAAMGAGFSVHAAPVALAPVAAPTLRIRGTVVDAQGAPLMGLRVTARRTGAVYDMNDPKTWGDWNTPAAFARRTKEIDTPSVDEEKSSLETKTGEDGAFLLETTEPGNYAVRAYPDAPRVAARGNVALTVAKPEAKVRLVVTSGMRFVGRVVDAADQGVAAVVSGSWTTSAGSSAPQSIYAPATRTDGAGGFALEAVPAGKGTLQVTIAGRAVLSGIAVTTPYEGTFVIRIGGGGVLKGRVLDGEGRGVAGADVMAGVSTSVAAGSHEPTGCQGRAKSGEDGSWRMDGVMLGRVVSMSVAAPGYTLVQQVAPRAAWAGAEVRAGQETAIDLVVKKTGAVAGRVTESGTGTPLPDVEMRLLRGDATTGGAPLVTLTDADGRYRFDDVPLGRHVLLPQSATHWSAEVETVAKAGQPVMYVAGAIRAAPPSLTVVLTNEGETAQRDVEMRRGLVVRGRVVGPDGRGVEGARVRSAAPINIQYQWSTSWFGGDYGVLATSGPDGAFAAMGLAPREDWVLVAAKDPYLGKPCEKFSLAAGASPPEVVLELQAGASVAGKAFDAEGKPGVGWSVWYWGMEGQNFQQNTNATTDLDGSFTISGLPAGKGQVQASGTGGSASKTIEALTLGESRTGIELRIEKGAELSGAIVDADGKSVASLSLSAQSESGGGQSGWASTGDDGTFTIKGFATGRTRLYASEPTDAGYSQSVVIGEPVQAPATGLRLVYTPKKRTTVTGRVVDGAGRPVPLCVISVAGSNPRGYGGTNPDEIVGGEFVKSIEGTPPLQLVVSAPRDGRGLPINLRSKSVTVNDAKEPVVVTLEVGQEVSGQVTGPDAKGVQGVTLKSGGSACSSDDDGRFRLSGLGEEADVDVTVEVPAKYIAPAPVRARAGQKDLAVRIALGWAIRGQVLDPDGKPVTNAQVQATWKGAAGQPGAMSGTTEGGAFKIEGLAENLLVTLHVSVWGTGTAKYRPVQIPDVRAGTSDLVVRMEAGVTIEGRLVYADGSPAGATWIGATRADRPDTGRLGAQTTDGAFTIGGLEPGVTYSLKVYGTSGAPAGELVRVEAPARNVRIVVPQPAKLNGRLEGGVAGATYYVQGWPSSGGPEAGMASAKVAPDGTFSMDLMGDRDYVLSVTAPKEDRYALAGPVHGGRGDVVLRFQPGLTIEGVVDDLPAGTAMVSAKGDRIWTGGKIEDGRFKVRGLAPGRYTLTVRTQSGDSSTVSETADAGATGVRLRWQK